MYDFPVTEADRALRRGKRAIFASVMLVVAAPVILAAGLGGNYYWNKTRAASDMSDTMEQVAIGDSLTDVRRVLAAAPVEYKLGFYEVGAEYLRSGGLRGESSTHVVRGFWLRNGITCYSELVVVDDIVRALGAVECESDGWLE